MSAELQSMFFLIGLIFGSVAIFVIGILWWFRREMKDEL